MAECGEDFKANTSIGDSFTTISTDVNHKDQSKFSERFSSDIAHPKKMAEYESFAESHRKLLERENKELNEKFSEELEQAHDIESSVASVASLLNDFSRLLEKQSVDIVDIHEDSKTTSNFVKDAEAQLVLTIERSKSSQRNMVIVTIGLSLLLLLLDFLTP